MQLLTGACSAQPGLACCNAVNRFLHVDLLFMASWRCKFTLTSQGCHVSNASQRNSRRYLHRSTNQRRKPCPSANLNSWRTTKFNATAPGSRLGVVRNHSRLFRNSCCCEIPPHVKMPHSTQIMSWWDQDRCVEGSQRRGNCACRLTRATWTSHPLTCGSLDTASQHRAEVCGT